MLALSSVSDTVAGDVLYHPSCYRDFTRKEALDKLRDTPAECTDVYSSAFSDLAKEVEAEIIQEGALASLTHLSKRFISLLKAHGCYVVDYRTEKLKRRLKKWFGEKIDFYNDANPACSIIVYSTSLPAALLAKKLQAQSKMQSDEIMSSDESEQSFVVESGACVQQQSGIHSNVKDVYGAACILRQEILSATNTFPFPPEGHLLREENFQIPSLLYNFLVWTTAGKISEQPLSADRLFVSAQLDRVVQSIASDVM